MQKDFDPTCKYRLSLVPAFAVCSVCLDASVSLGFCRKELESGCPVPKLVGSLFFGMLGAATSSDPLNSLSLPSMSGAQDHV